METKLSEKLLIPYRFKKAIDSNPISSEYIYIINPLMLQLLDLSLWSELNIRVMVMRPTKLKDLQLITMNTLFKPAKDRQNA